MTLAESRSSAECWLEEVEEEEGGGMEGGGAEGGGAEGGGTAGVDKEKFQYVSEGIRRMRGRGVPGLGASESNG